MVLSARFLADVGGVNAFAQVRNVEFTAGDTLTVYLQLIDSSKDLAADGFRPGGRRYVPAAGASLAVTINNVDDSKKITRLASQPFAGDSSIWSFTIMATDPIVGTADLRLVLTEGSTVTKGRVDAALRVQSASNL